MAASTSLVRFPGYVNSSMTSVIAPLIPTPRCHFIMSSLTPLEVDNPTTTHLEIRKTTVLDVVRRLLQESNYMVSIPPKTGAFISLLHILRGQPDPAQVRQAMSKLRERKMAEFIPWGPASVQIAVARPSAYVKQKNHLSGLLLANHTSINSVFRTCLEQYDVLMRRRAFLDNYRKEAKFAENFDEFDIARESIETLMHEYSSAEQPWMDEGDSLADDEQPMDYSVLPSISAE